MFNSYEVLMVILRSTGAGVWKFLALKKRDRYCKHELKQWKIMMNFIFYFFSKQCQVFTEIQTQQKAVWSGNNSDFDLFCPISKNSWPKKVAWCQFSTMHANYWEYQATLLSKFYRYSSRSVKSFILFILLVTHYIYWLDKGSDSVLMLTLDQKIITWIRQALCRRSSFCTWLRKLWFIQLRVKLFDFRRYTTVRYRRSI